MDLTAKNVFLLVGIATSLLLNSLVYCQQLNAGQSQVKLPSSRILTSALYDGEDLIYIVGGFAPFKSPLSDFLIYNVASDTIEAIESTYPLYSGNLVSDSNGRIFYCGGMDKDEFHRGVLEFDLVEERWRNVSSLPQTKVYSAAIQPTSDTAYLIGGSFDSAGITLFNITSLTAEEYDFIPELLNHGDTTAVWDDVDEIAVIFSSPEIGNTTVVKYSFANKNYTVVSDSYPNLQFSSSVWDGRNAYIIGGGGLGLNNGIIQYDPVTEALAFFPVQNFPAQEERFYETASVYVKKFNRIYFFGGRLDSAYTDGIWWIDLEPLAPTTTTPIPTTTQPTTTTEKPTTTQATTTQASTTQASTTQASTTQASTTQASTTQASTTQEATTSEAPTTTSPTTTGSTTVENTSTEPTTTAMPTTTGSTPAEETSPMENFPPPVFSWLSWL